MQSIFAISRPMRRLLAGVLVAGVAGLCAGCGSDDDTSSNAAAASTPTSVTTIEPTTTTTTAPTTTLTEPADPPVRTATTTTSSTATTPATPATPERAAYIAKADAVCEAGNAAVKKLNEQANKAIRGADNDKDRLRAIAPILREGLRIQTADLKRLEAVTPPAADRSVIAGYWNTLDQQAVLLGQLADAAAAVDLATYQQVSKKSNLLRDEARSIARDFGFKKCGSGDSDAA